MIKIIGNRILVKKVEAPKKEEEGFQKVEVFDDFLYKGEVVRGAFVGASGLVEVRIGDIVLFDKYSRGVHEVDVEGQKMKLVPYEDILAIL